MIILSSKSPRRHDILFEFGIMHKVVPSECIEKLNDQLSPRENVEQLSLQKALDVFNKYPNEVILGADTIVTINNKILGKPKDLNEAKQMLKLLSGKSHEVITGVTIIKDNIPHTFSVTTTVEFQELTDLDIDTYISKDNVLDKAGAYAIQSPNMIYIKSINGSYYNVVGLPIEEIIKKFEELNIEH